MPVLGQVRGGEDRAPLGVARDARHRGGVGRQAVRTRLEVVDGERAAVGGAERDLGAVALHAARLHAGETVDLRVGDLAGRRRVRVERHPRALDDLGQVVVERGEDVAGQGVVAALELRHPPARGSARSRAGVTTVAML